jgi:spore coat protein U-like protein
MINMHKHPRFTPNVFGLVVMALALAGTGNATAADTIASSTGIVVAPIKITKAVDLSFGTFAGGSTAGTVTVSPDNTRGVTGGAVKMGGTPAAAKFDVTGQDGAGYTITLGGSTELTSGANTIPFQPISDVTASSITSGTVGAGVLTGGAQSLYVGGVLTVAANQAAGTYTGTITATVQYN